MHGLFIVLKRDMHTPNSSMLFRHSYLQQAPHSPWHHVSLEMITGVTSCVFWRKYATEGSVLSEQLVSVVDMLWFLQVEK